MPRRRRGGSSDGATDAGGGEREHGNGGGGSREMVGTRGAGRKHEAGLLPNGLPVWRDWHLFGPKPLCPLFVCIRAVPNPSWGLLNTSRVLGCKPLPLPARMYHWVSPCPRAGGALQGS
jgi:hypothetical protein